MFIALNVSNNECRAVGQLLVEHANVRGGDDDAVELSSFHELRVEVPHRGSKDHRGVHRPPITGNDSFHAHACE
jgi:hypothetical protein